MIEDLRKRNVNGYMVSDIEEAREKVMNLINKGDSVGFGGSATLEETGILDILRIREDIDLLDRNKVDGEEKEKLYRDIFSCDVYLSGTNAITKDGKLINVDGRGNRVAAITYGPKKVIIIVGKNKIVSDVDAGLERIKKVAVPKNIEKLKSKGGDWTEDNIWGQVSIIERQRNTDRMHVIIVNKELGY